MNILYLSQSIMILANGSEEYTYLNLKNIQDKQSNDNWILVKYRNLDLNNNLQIETNINCVGEYCKIIIRQNKIIRIIELCNSFVTLDKMYDTNQYEYLKNSYIAYQADNHNKKPILLEDYLKINRVHESSNGNLLIVPRLNNKIIAKFLIVNSEQKVNENIKVKKLSK